MRLVLSLIILTILSTATGASADEFPTPHAGWWLEKPIGEERELVMGEGFRLVAEDALGSVTITAQAGYQRTYSWDGGACVRSSTHWARSERWYGSYGIYFPGPGYHWVECNGIARGVLEEGQIHFDRVENAAKWIDWKKSMCREGCAVAYTSNGLVLVSGKSPARKQLNVGLYQIYINGERPQGLPGASDSIYLEFAGLN